MSGVFYVFCCKECGKWGVKEIRSGVLKAVYQCKYCSVSCKIKQVNVYALSLKSVGPFNLPMDATRKCQELNLGNRKV